MQILRRLEVARFASAHECAELAWKQIRSDADHSNRANRHERQRQTVVAAQNRKLFRQFPSQLSYAVNAAARFLDRNDVATPFRQPKNSLRANIDPTSPGNVVKHH